MASVAVPAHDMTMARSYWSVTHGNAVVVVATVVIVVIPPPAALQHRQDQNSKEYTLDPSFHDSSPFSVMIHGHPSLMHHITISFPQPEDDWQGIASMPTFLTHNSISESRLERDHSMPGHLGQGKAGLPYKRISDTL